MKEVNELTRWLLAEGWQPEDTPPGTRPYQDYDGGWTYTGEAIRSMVWETPCGLLADGRHFLNGYMSYQGIDWRPENGNPVLCCPVFPSAPCPLRDPLLHTQGLSCHSGDVAYQCACHQTGRPYTYESSVDETHDHVWREADKLWEVFKAQHKGRVCRQQSHYGRTTKTWRAYYDPMDCANFGCCSYCDVLAKELDTRKGNVFYDLRKSWTVKGEGLFPDQRKTMVEKGHKLLDRTASLTLCEAIVKYGRHRVEERVRSEFHHDLFFNKSLEIEVINLRAARVDKRDILQDLQDVTNGIEVIHAADSLKAAKAQKQARREAAKARRIRKAEAMILAHGWDALEDTWKRRAEKLLDEDRIDELLRQRQISKEAPPAETQICLYASASDRPLDAA
ncbi:hypothetical protein [uncultured Oscillibacter sp.]|uniref:hypothetical protein n=1 Tax=uncultured Oscillibacter sp. TaxID=876091 RepID=UPI002621CD9C|nr:hypothetical protein [uncultured Oscillibacter sp.]